jgi:hypothetical protein
VVVPALGAPTRSRFGSGVDDVIAGGLDATEVSREQAR